MGISSRCHIISVVGGKGGVGKSIVAANLAATTFIELNQPTLLIDLDAQTCGDQNIITGLKPVKTFGELVSFQGQINSQTLPSLLSKHPGGFFFSGAVRGLGETLQVSADLSQRCLEQLSQNFSFIVVDLGSQLGSLQHSVLEVSSIVLAVTVPEPLALNQTARLINELTAGSLPSDFIHVVINKASPNGINPQAIGQSLRRPVVGLIPQDDLAVSTSLSRGQPFVLAPQKTTLSASYHDLVRRLTTGGLLQKLQGLSKPNFAAKRPVATSSTEVPGPVARGERALDPRTLLKIKVHTALIQAMDLKKGVTDTKGDPAKELSLRTKTQQTIAQILDVEQPGMARDERNSVIKEVLDEALGLGPLEELLSDDTVSEIMVNGRDRIFVERNGRLTLSNLTFTSNLQLRNIIERIVTPLGRRIDEKTPYVDARLKDGSRVNAVIEPIAIDGPSLTIRKFAKKAIGSHQYVEWGTMTQNMVDFLRVCVENGLNVIVSGGTGSGKTTLLNVLSSFIPSNERIVTVEDAAELQLKQEHVVRLETRPANMEGTGAISIRDLVRNSLRMRPDRILVGECRGGEALDMLSAMNTGHDGSMTTLHANSPREAISRLETLCLMAGMDLPVKAIREQIAGAVDLIIQISRLSDGSRKILSITEVVGIQGETITLQEIFRFKEEGSDKNRKIIGQFQAMGLIPTFIEEFERKGINVPRTLFSGSGASNGPNSQSTLNQPLKKVSGGKP